MNHYLNKFYLVFPLLFPFLLLTQHELIIALGVFLLIIITLFFEYTRREWLLPVVGTVFGIIAEVGGDMIYKLQYWDQGSFFGLPLWLPLLWGYGFLYIGRVSQLVVYKNSKK